MNNTTLKLRSTKRKIYTCIFLLTSTAINCGGGHRDGTITPLAPYEKICDGVNNNRKCLQLTTSLATVAAGLGALGYKTWKLIAGN